MRRQTVFCVLLGLATVGLSRFFAAWRAWRAVPSLDAAAQVVGLGAGLVAVMLVLGFILYEADRTAGRVRKQVGLYEWVLARRGEARPRRAAVLEGAGAAGPGERPPARVGGGRWPA